MSLQGTLPDTGAKVSLFNDPAVRGIAYQVVVALVIVFLFYEATSNAVENLRAAKIASGFGFMENTAGFDINQTLIHFSSTDGSTYGRAFYVGLLNTLLVVVHRHRLLDGARLHHGHSAAFAELDRAQAVVHLCRGDPQHPAAAAIAVLVQRGVEAVARSAQTASRSLAASTSTIAA